MEEKQSRRGGGGWPVSGQQPTREAATGGGEAPEGWELMAKGPKARRVSDRGS